MFCIPLEGLANLFCNNEAVVKNTTMHTSTLKKKHNLIVYHHIREAIAAAVLWITKEGSETNLANMFTNFLPGPRLKKLCQQILF